MVILLLAVLSISDLALHGAAPTAGTPGFRNDVQPILAKFGCSSGACHGAAAGQNGFKLSLRGYDDENDYLALTRHALGRRIVPSDPGRSLLLLKATGAVPHKGGKRFSTDAPEYHILAEWIAAGAPGPKPTDPLIERLEISPTQVTLKPGDTQQFVVRARFSDGRSQDVTAWVKYSDANSAVTQADETGSVKVLGFGEGAVTAWYLSRIAIATVTVPYTNDVAAETFASAPRRNFIDEHVLAKLQRLRLPPSPRCDDATFVRRAFLDTIGILPTVEEAAAFSESGSPRKRDDLIESLLRRPEFVDFWTYKWSDLLLVQSASLRPAAMWSYYNWIRNHVAANTAWDTLVRQLVTAQGSTLENGGANFFVLHDDPRRLAETTSLAFLGMSINCAQCHNHPLEKWTNDEYYGFANLFARVRTKDAPGEGNRVIFAANVGDLVQPLRGKPQAPRPLDGHALPPEAGSDRREALADWLTAPDNPYFARAIVNRIWANFFAVGLVEKVDDLRVTNPASNEDLLQAAAEMLAENKFDLKALMRAILQSETYQRSSEALPGNETETRFYSRYYPRRLMAEVLLDTFSQVTEVPTEFSGYPKGWRAMQLPDSKLESYFLKSFGRPDRDLTCSCERTTEPSVGQVLHIANGSTLNQKLAAKNNRLDKWLSAHPSTSDLVTQSYLATLCRAPSDEERRRVNELLENASAEKRREALEDLLWALFSSREFLFNH